MTKNLPVPTADEINKAHEFARESAGMAVEWAVKCGQLLAAKKTSMPRGEFDGWIKDNCDFGRATAYNYMKHSKSSNALDGSAIRHLFPSGQPGHKPKPVTNTPKGAVSVVNPPGDGQDGTEETGQDRPAASATKPLPGRGAPPPGAAVEPDIEDWAPDEDEDAALELAEKEYAASIDKVMDADDKLAAAHAEIKRQAAEIASLKLSRNSFQSRCAEILDRYKKAQRVIAKLEKQLGKKAA